MESAKNTALAPWFGSKRNLAPTIAEELGPHCCYFEPFCGSVAARIESGFDPPSQMNVPRAQKPSGAPG